MTLILYVLLNPEKIHLFLSSYYNKSFIYISGRFKYSKGDWTGFWLAERPSWFSCSWIWWQH